MPELPEVETIRRDLEGALKGRRVVALTVYDRRLMPAEQESRFRRQVLEQTWSGFERRGKYLSVDLASGWQILFHLRMTGQLVIGQAEPPSPQRRLSLTFENGSVLWFLDQRRFGEVFLVEPGGPWPVKQGLG